MVTHPAHLVQVLDYLESTKPIAHLAVVSDPDSGTGGPESEFYAGRVIRTCTDDADMIEWMHNTRWSRTICAVTFMMQWLANLIHRQNSRSDHDGSSLFEHEQPEVTWDLAFLRGSLLLPHGLYIFDFPVTRCYQFYGHARTRTVQVHWSCLRSVEPLVEFFSNPVARVRAVERFQ